MVAKLALGLLLALACLSASGCSGPGLARGSNPPGQAAAGKSDDERHADLERELGLYSD